VILGDERSALLPKNKKKQTPQAKNRPRNDKSLLISQPRKYGLGCPNMRSSTRLVAKLGRSVLRSDNDATDKPEMVAALIE
jgi:hypothetical protein